MNSGLPIGGYVCLPRGENGSPRLGMSCRSLTPSFDYSSPRPYHPPGDVSYVFFVMPYRIYFP
jgi:hypothetical protein